MKKGANFWVLVTCFCLVSAVGNATTPPRTGVVLEYGIPPSHITTETDLNIGVALMMSPCLNFLVGHDPYFYHMSADNHITYVFSTIIYGPCPNVEVLVAVHNIGQLPEGDYTMQVYIVFDDSEVPGTINDPLGDPLGDLIRFTVYAPAMPVPAIGLWGISLMIIGVLLSLFLLRKKKLWLTAGLLLFCGSLSAKNFIILLSNQSGAPTPEQVVNQAVISPPPPSYLLGAENYFQ